MANKYVKNTKEGAKGSNHAHIAKRTQGRKVKEDGDKVEEKHGMKPRPPPPPHNIHTLSLQGMTTNHGQTMVWQTSM